MNTNTASVEEASFPTPETPAADSALDLHEAPALHVVAPQPPFFFWSFLGMLFFSLYLLYTIFQPFLHSLILGCIFTALSYPLYVRFLRFTGNKPMLASLMVLLCLTFLVVIPITLFIIGLIPQAGKSVTAINSWIVGAQSGELINGYLNPVLLWTHNMFPDFDIASLDIHGTIRNAVGQTGQVLLGAGTYLIGHTVTFIIHFALVLLIMFFLLMDGVNMVSKLTYYYPLKPRQTAVLFESSRRMAKSVLVGGFAVAALQGIVGGIGLAIAGLPALFWGTVMCFAALVPVVGTGLVWVPAVILLFLQKNTFDAVFLLIWCGVGVTCIDSFLRPILLKDGANVPLLFIFLSILGGINVFGMLGLLYGPLILSFVVTMLEFYGEEYKHVFQSRNSEESDCSTKP